MIELRGAERTYRLDCSGVNALCRLEELTGRPYEAVIKELRGTRAKASTVQAFIASALLDLPESPDDLAAIVEDLGGVKVIRKAVRQASGMVRPRKKARRL